MNSAQIEIQLIASLVAVACAIPGTFLVLRKMAMISDAISHSILPGIVVGFFITHDLNSPLLIILAALTGIITVVLVEYIQKTGLVKEDTAIGLVFPTLFSIGVIMIAKNANDVHLDIDAVLLGELAFAPFDRLIIAGTDVGPKALWIIGVILIVTLILLLAFFKELKVSTFDKGLATSLGFSPAIIHYGLMSVSSVTTVGAFDAVGAASKRRHRSSAARYFIDNPSGLERDTELSLSTNCRSRSSKSSSSSIFSVPSHIESNASTAFTRN